MAEDALADVDSDSLDLDALEQKGNKLAKKEKKPAAANQPHMALRIFLGASGILLIVGFFLPWLTYATLPSVSGLQLVFDEAPEVRRLVPEETMRWLLLAVPGFGVALTAVGFLGLRWSGQVSAVLGVLLLLYGLVTFIIFFFQFTGVGLWLVLGGSFLAIFAGAVTWARARALAPPKKLKK